MANGVLGLEGFDNHVGGLTVTKDFVSRFTLPESFGSGDTEVVARDCELLGELFREHSEEMARLVDACLRNDTAEAQRIAAEVGFSEEHFTSNGGGLWHLLIVAAVLGGHFLKWW